jgi:hypothetical protein
MYKYRLLLFLLTIAASDVLFPFSAWSQCTPNQVVEAVTNGNFEQGYLTSATSGGFNSDLSYVGNYVPGAGPCHYSIANEYAVGRAETPANLANCTVNARQTYAGEDYINIAGGFNDHTPGQGGNGFALIADFESYGGGKWDTDPSGLPAVWRQQVTIQTGQKYYFSAWFANYNRLAGTGGYTNPILNFVVIPMSAGVPVYAQRVNLGNAAPTGQMNWQQFSGQWTNPGVYTSVMLLIEVQAANQANTNDFAIDDISFINGCDNLSSLPSAYQPDLGADFSLCTVNGSATLNSNVTNSATNQFWWYSGTGTTQTTLINGTSTDYTYNITTPGTYRVCVQNAGFPTGCSASSTVVVSNTMSPVTLADQNICTSSTVTLTALLPSGATYSGTGLTYAWTHPASAPASVNSPTYTTGVTGSYSVTITPGAAAIVAGCTAVTSNTATVTTSLVTPSFVSGNCSGATKTFTLSSTAGSGNTYGWYDAATGGNLKGTGNPVTITYTAAQVPTTVYLENYNTNASAVAIATSAAVNDDGGGGSAWNSTNFTVTQDFTIQSIYISSAFGTGTATITLANASAPGTTIASATQVISATGTWYQVPVNFSVTAGNSYIINMSGGSIRFHLQYGYSSTSYDGGIVTINPNANGTSGSAVQWTIKTGSACMRTPFTIDCTLPVTFLSFNIEGSGNAVNLNWVTASEKDAKLFMVERSLDGSSYTAIGQVNAYNNLNGGTYGFVDRNPLKANVYYRLREIDINGSVTESQVRYLAFSATEQLSVFPNPVKDVVLVMLPSTTKSDMINVSVQLYNSLGQELVTKVTSTAQLNDGLSLDLSTVSRGTYILKIISVEGEWVEQLIKE